MCGSYFYERKKNVIRNNHGKARKETHTARA